MGLVYAGIVVVAFGIGDFLIQKSTRRFGDVLSFFYIASFGLILFTPFVLDEVPQLSLDSVGFLLLMAASVAILIAGLGEFEAFREGKLSVIEPLLVIELPVATLVAAMVIREIPTPTQLITLALLLLGIFLVSVRSFEHLRSIRWERGTALALLSACGMALADFLFGVSARATSPLMVNWFTDVFAVIVLGGYLLVKGRGHEIREDFVRYRGLILKVSFFDNIAWLSYSAAMVTLPIAIATGITESYVALSALLGLTLNHERLEEHQKAGLAITILSAIFLGFQISG